MTRVQVLLTEEQDRRLESLARRKRVSKTRLVREGVDLVLLQAEAEGPDPLLSLIGQAGRVGKRKLSIEHDAVLMSPELGRNRRDIYPLTDCQGIPRGQAIPGCGGAEPKDGTILHHGIP